MRWMGRDRYDAGADAAVGIGLASATLAAASGLADWSHSEGAGRRVGVLHAALNGSATLCYLASWLLRKRDQREAGRGHGLGRVRAAHRGRLSRRAHGLP